MSIYKHKASQFYNLSKKAAFFLFLLLTLTAHAQQAQAEDATTLILIAEEHILSNLPTQLKEPKVTISALPKNTQKPDCEHTPSAQYHGKQRIGNINVVVSCQQPRWQQYIHAQVTGLLAVYTARTDIIANTAFDANNLKLTWLPHQQVSRQHISNIDLFAHKSSRQFISAGTPIRLSYLKDNVLVQRNNPVRIVSADPRIRIEMEGIALESGSYGQAIRVKNTSSDKTIKAYVQSADMVVVR